MDQEALKKQVAKREIAPLYYFYGQNTHRIEATVSAIYAALFPAGTPEFDCTFYDAELHAPGEILNSAQTFPLVFPRRLVVVKRAEAFKAGAWDAFRNYFTKPAPHCCLIFISDTDKPAIKEKLLHLFQASGRLVLFENPSRQQVSQVIQTAVAASGKKIARPALSYMLETIGTDSQVVHQELEKVLLYCTDKPTIEKEDVEGLLSDNGEQTIFQLVDKIGREETEAACILLNALMENGMEPLPILGMIARQFRLLAVVREAVERGEKAFQITRTVNEFNKKLAKGRGLSSTLVDSLVEQAKGWSLERIGRAFEAMAQADLQLKSTRIDKKLVLENLIFQCR